jgi:hypothetical protein
MNWVIDAVVNCNALKVVFPDCHLKQKKMAKEFEKKSTPGFKNCVGAIDGMLVWIEKSQHTQKSVVFQQLMMVNFIVIEKENMV